MQLMLLMLREVSHTDRIASSDRKPQLLWSLSKSNITDGSAFAWGKNNTDCFPQLIFYVQCRSIIPLHGTWKFWLGRAAWLAEPLVLTNKVDFVKCICKTFFFLHLPNLFFMDFISLVCCCFPFYYCCCCCLRCTYLNPEVFLLFPFWFSPSSHQASDWVAVW